MIIEGTAVVINGDNIDTDVLYPGPYLNIDDPELMKEHLFDGLDPGLRNRLRGPTVLVVGENFGIGSSREHVPLAMKASGVRAVVGGSFARIFFRNCINLALPAVQCPGAADAAGMGSAVTIDPRRGEVKVDGTPFEAVSLPDFIVEMVTRGGLEPWVRHRLDRR